LIVGKKFFPRRNGARPALSRALFLLLRHHQKLPSRIPPNNNQVRLKADFLFGQKPVQEVDAGYRLAFEADDNDSLGKPGPGGGAPRYGRCANRKPKSLKKYFRIGGIDNCEVVIQFETMAVEFSREAQHCKLHTIHFAILYK